MSDTSQKPFKNFSEYITSYAIGFDEAKKSIIFVEATLFGKDHKPLLWAVRRNSNVFSKVTGQFGHEPIPSSRLKGFNEEYRFATAEEGVKAWKQSLKK